MSATDPILHAKAAAREFASWLDHTVRALIPAGHEARLSSWQNELGVVGQQLDQADRIQIALVGTTGAGKSTFLNAVLGQELLPVGVMEPCTAFVSRVRRSADSRYRVVVEFLTREQWSHELAYLSSTFAPGDDDGVGESRRIADAARKRVAAVYGIAADAADFPTDLQALPLPAIVETTFAAGSRKSEAFDSAKEMEAYLRRLIRGESALWPLVTQVSVTGPYACLAGGIELVDLPGLNDPNEARIEVTREFLRKSPFVWVVFSMVRGLTADIQAILREEKLLRTLVLSGAYGALSLIGTKADDIDTNVADQLGLGEDCSTEDLINAYREQGVTKARQQLEEMVRDLSYGSHDTEAVQQMIELARNVRVHATSSSAFMKLKGIGRLRKDYGLDSEVDTGIPAVHEHLAEIARECGAERRAESVLKRLDQLADEIAFFFRAQQSADTPAAETARVRIARERDIFCTEVQSLRESSDARLHAERGRFLERLDPLLKTSVEEIHRTTERWRGIHWAPLRAIVQRDGVFKSPSNGRTYDLNQDLTEPLLRQLPITWEQYFTHDLGRVTGDFELRLLERGKALAKAIGLIVEGVFNRDSRAIDGQLDWFQRRIAHESSEIQRQVLETVRERRSELAADIPRVAKGRMQSAYEAAKTESGSGMKARILERLERAALAAASPMYATIQADLLRGLQELEQMLAGLLHRLAQHAEEQADIVAQNAHVDVEEAAVAPRITKLLSTVPRFTSPTGQPLAAAAGMAS